MPPVCSALACVCVRQVVVGRFGGWELRALWAVGRACLLQGCVYGMCLAGKAVGNSRRRWWATVACQPPTCGVMRRSARMAATALRSALCCGGGKGRPGGQRAV